MQPVCVYTHMCLSSTSYGGASREMSGCEREEECIYTCRGRSKGGGGGVVKLWRSWPDSNKQE